MLRKAIMPALAIVSVLANTPNILPVSTIILGFSMAQAAHAEDAAAVKYTCPMHPQVISDKPGTCPICGMSLVPMSADDHSSSMRMESPIITIEVGTIQKMGVRTEMVMREDAKLIISSTAVLRSADGDHVIVALGDGKFQARDVTTQEAGNAKAEVLTGLKEGETVVTQAQFLIDSESNLRDALNKLSGPDNAGK